MSLLNSLRTPVLAGVRSAVRSTSDIIAKPVCNIQVRNMGAHRTMPLVPSRHMWERMKDDLHYFFTLGLVPIGVIIACMNTYIGPAELQEIPEGYVPKDYEYLKCPIQRAWQKYYFYPTYEKSYERHLYYLNKAHEKRLTVLKMKKANEMMKSRQDYKNWYFVPTNVQERTAVQKYRSEDDRNTSL